MVLQYQSGRRKGKVNMAPKTMENRSGNKGISGSTLKLVAIIAMFIDHAAAIILARVLLGGAEGLMRMDMGMYRLYLVMRLIGRLGFPIFCYLLIEGFLHTRNLKKYAGRLLLFALVSEIPFDLGFAGELFYWEYQNVFFTLFIGLMVIAGFRYVDEKQWNKVLRVAGCVLLAAAGAGAAALLQTDYAATGVLTIAAMYLFRKNRMLEAIAGCTLLICMQGLEISSFLILIPIRMYNGTRGWNIKWFFYIFYPAHILLLYLIAAAMGLGQVRLMM